MKLLFVHGWGFDSHVWSAIAALLEDMEHAFDDRGYFGSAEAGGDATLAVTHSFGTMRLLADPPPSLAGIVAINGFERFTPGVPVRVVDRMLRRFDEDPRAVLAEFRRTCGAEDAFGAIDAAPLRADLVRLRDGQAPPPSVPLTMLHGARDAILPAAMRAEGRVHPAAGHLLPLEDPEFCAAAVREMAAALA